MSSKRKQSQQQQLNAIFKQPPGILRPPAGFSNENRLKQIYEAKNIIIPTKKHSVANPSTQHHSNDKQG